MNIIFRQAGKEDAELIADLSRKTFFETFSAANSKADMDKFLNEQFTKGKLMLEVGQVQNQFFIAYSNNEPAAYLKLRDDKKPAQLAMIPSLEIARLYVVKNMIGKGIGQVLMQKCIDVAMQQRKRVLWLGVWEKNKRAIDFYTRWGFVKIGNSDFLLGDDVQNDWLMKKDL